MMAILRSPQLSSKARLTLKIEIYIIETIFLSGTFLHTHFFKQICVSLIILTF